MNRITSSYTYSELNDYTELPEAEQKLVKLSREMTQAAYSPYSNFRVGAAVLLENGTITKGSNQENAAYPSGLCAERVAVFSASANNPKTAIKTIAISASSPKKIIKKPVSPCGSCRQALIEYEAKQKKPIKVILTGEKGKVLVIESISDLLPLHFTNVDLQINE